MNFLALNLPAVEMLKAGPVHQDLVEVSLRLQKEMTIQVNVRKNFRGHLKKEKGAQTVLSEKDHLIRFNPGQVVHPVLKKNLFKKEKKDQEVKDLSKKENQAHLIQDQTDQHDSLRNLLQNGKTVARIALSEKENPAHLIHARTELHASPKSLFQNVKKEIKSLFKKENPVRLIPGKKDHPDLKRNHFKKETQKAVKKNHLKKVKGKTNLFAKAAILDYPTRESRLIGNAA